MAPTQLSIVLEGLLNELGTADLSTLEAMLKHDTGAVLARDPKHRCSRRGWCGGLCQLGHEQCCCVPRQLPLM